MLSVEVISPLANQPLVEQDESEAIWWKFIQTSTHLYGLSMYCHFNLVAHYFVILITLH
ncbi:protein of unknown function [Rhodovastum atsumiense]|nr:protein of unknown function [Rhodovastum atsumiense]